MPKILSKGVAAEVGQGASGLRPGFAGGLGEGNQAGLLKDPEVGSQIAVGHDQQVPQVGVGQGRGG